MKIISPFRDYYDSARAWGEDNNVLYLREQKVIKLSVHDVAAQIPKSFQQIVQKLPLGHNFNTHLICFCGRPYLAYSFFVKDKESPALPLEDILHDTEKQLKNTHDKFESQFFPSRAAAKRWLEESNSAWGTHTGYKDMAKIEETLKQAQVPLELFHRWNCPVFTLRFKHHYYGSVGESYTVELNPQLKSFGFFKYMDAFTAYQELSMFVGGVLSNLDGAPCTSGDDRVLAAAKGFDEYSFRTLAPGAKKLNRKQNRECKKNGPSNSQ